MASKEWRKLGGNWLDVVPHNNAGTRDWRERFKIQRNVKRGVLSGCDRN